MGSNEKSTCQNDCVRKGTGITFDILLVGFNCNLFYEKFSMFAINLPHEDIFIERIADVICFFGYDTDRAGKVTIVRVVCGCCCLLVCTQII